jgi:hypothetical protein
MRPSLLLVPLTLCAVPLHGQQSQPCAGPEYRQFDFWEGTWNVFNQQGQQVGTNTIERTLDGCALHEQWKSATGSSGFSYSIYDRSRGKWHQTWVDSGGLLLTIEGGLIEGRMVLTGITLGQQGAKTLNRISWTPIASDSVRQFWETSTDSGKTWSVAFDGMYVRKGG